MGGWITMVHHCNSGFRPCPSPTSMMPLPAINTWKGLITNVIRLVKNASVVIMMAITIGIICRNLRRFVKTMTQE